MACLTHLNKKQKIPDEKKVDMQHIFVIIFDILDIKASQFRHIP